MKLSKVELDKYETGVVNKISNPATSCELNKTSKKYIRKKERKKRVTLVLKPIAFWDVL